MGTRITLAARLLAALAVGATVVVLAEPVAALTVPETLAERRPVQAGPVDPAFPIDSVGVIWDAPHDGHGADRAGSHGAVRFRSDGSWGPWIDLVEDGAAAAGQWASALVDGGDADAYQVRGLPASARSARAVAINTTDGPAVEIGQRRGAAAGALTTSCRSRADWGADESLRFEDGTEVWPAQHTPVQTLTVHHTATANGETGTAAEARLRSIYRYHAVDRGWGDIGYQYLIDAAGVVYEGRWSGTASSSCAPGGDGSDFGHGDGDQMVVGAHVGGYNSGNLGVSLLGTFTQGGAAPTAAAVDGLEAVLAELGTRHDLDPEGTVGYVNPVNGSRKTVPTISAHRDWEATECPGDRLYAQLPDIRAAVADAMAGGDTTTSPQTPLTVSAIAPRTLPVGSTAVTITGSGFDSGAAVRLANGKGKPPTAGPTSVVDDSTLETTVTVQGKGPKGLWDVVVTLPDGREAICSGCAYVQR